MDFSDYQANARKTAQLNPSTRTGRIELVLGLSSEAGTVARVYKRLLRDKVSLNAQREQITDGLGDVLWYVSMIATSVGLKLEDVARGNLARTADRYATVGAPARTWVPSYDAGYLETERFPRQMVFKMKETINEEGMPEVEFSLVQALPNAFPNGAVAIDGSKKKIGFTLGKPIGNVINDNALREDGYRYHDAVHIAFVVFLGWSPVLRGLLRLKRKSKLEVDRVQDGARAQDLEEALSSILAEMSESRNHFAHESDVDGEVRDMIRRVVSNLEVAKAPIWQWARAISNGYNVMAELIKNKGGYVLADLDQQIIEFHKLEPKLES
jgi:NTP pyrophosphatase (non-canonical NTP hydrolase)